MVSRRQFVRNAAGAFTALSLPVLPALSNLPPMPPPVENPDDDYWLQIRRQFPLRDTVAYLNNGTMGPSPQVVLDAVRQTMEQVDSKGEYGHWESCVAPLAAFTGASEDEIALTHNVSEGINTVCWGLPLKRRDEVILCNHEHVGNALPWLNRARLDGIRIKVFELAPTAAETLTRLNDAIGRRTRVIAIPHIPCTNGQILPAREIVQLARSKGLWVMLDGAHPPGMLQLNLHEIDPDFYPSCCHKWMLGPKGTGFLYVKKDRQELLQARFVGGGSDAGWDVLSQPPVLKGYAPSAHRYYYGTQNWALYKGVVAATEFLKEIGMDKIEKRIRTLAADVQRQLLELGDRVEMVTPVEAASRGAVISFRLKKIPYDQLSKKAMDNSIRLRVVPENNLNCVRVSTHIYNTREEIGRLMDLIRKEA